MNAKKAKFSIGEIVKHKHFNFRDVMYDVDLNLIIQKNGESIPKDVRPKKTNHLSFTAENNEITYEAYVSEQNLIIDSWETQSTSFSKWYFLKGSGYYKPSNWCFCHKFNKFNTNLG